MLKKKTIKKTKIFTWARLKLMQETQENKTPPLYMSIENMVMGG